jgi:hypothetical protein
MIDLQNQIKNIIEWKESDFFTHVLYTMLKTTGAIKYEALVYRTSATDPPPLLPRSE